MITANQTIVNALISPVREIKAGVELFEGSTLIESCKCDGRLIKFDVERIGDTSKFFGYGVCQRLNVHLIDKDRTLDVTTAYRLKVAYLIGDEVIYPYPTFYVSEVHRDENTNELSITAYDLMYKAVDYTVNDMVLPGVYSYLYFASAASRTLNTSGLKFANISDISVFQTEMTDGVNFEGHESVRDALDDLAEATQCIYYIDNDNWLVFKRLDKDGDAVLQINKSQYITLSSKTNRRLGTIAHVTELGENIEVSHTTGTTQYVRDNAFWTKLEPTVLAAELEKAKEAVCGLSINQFECAWRGNFLLEIGDKIALTAKDNSIVYSYVIDDTIEYTGGLIENTKWQYTGDDSETDAAPTSLGEALNQTYAKVDKLQKRVELVASDKDEWDEKIAKLTLTTEQMEASVANMEQKVSQVMTPEDVSIMIENSKSDGVTAVTTTTGFTFNEEGLRVTKTNSEVSTIITDDGMTVSRDDADMLIADSFGVQAVNLHANTYLIIGKYSRFEDMEPNRTGCYWVG